MGGNGGGDPTVTKNKQIGISTNKNRCNVVLSYEWSKNDAGMSNTAYKAFKKLSQNINNRLGVNKNLVNYRRLRGSAGSFLFPSIFKMIRNADIIIVDITNNNQNVLLELGIAIAIQQEVKSDLEIYLIREVKKRRNKIPSNLVGYFITDYSMKKKKVTFNDTNSLMMSISNRLITKMQLSGDYALPINELDEK